ncbi:MAG: hypothetical protein HY814_00745 [Candidatus Riflebacteria bacterium]|nr:hypothetical protein [Candidatus Riflebacteria bacterium]
MNAGEAMVADYQATGLTTGAHPMRFLRSGLERRRVLTAARVARARGGRKVQVAGIVIARQGPPTAKGFLFLTLRDETGLANVVVKPWLVKREGPAVCRAALLLVDGILEEGKGVRNIVARHVEGLQLPEPTVTFRWRDFR